MIYDALTELRNWVGVITAGWVIYGVATYVKTNIKEIKENHLHHLKLGIDTISADMKDQTNAIVGELKELRGDLRSLTGAFIAPPVKYRPRAAKRK